MPDHRAAAFLDFDHTLVDCDAGVVFGRALAIQRWRQLKEEPWLARWRGILRLGAVGLWLGLREGFLWLLHAMRIVKRSTMVRRTYKLFEGIRADVAYRRMEEIFHDRVASRFFPEVLDEVAEHRSEGRDVVIVTSGMRPLVRHAERYLGEVDIIGVDLREDEGRFTGEVEGPLWGAEKRDAVVRYARDRGIDLAASWAYSDHFSDVPFLESVGHPVAVNPDDRLRKHAERLGWRVLDPERTGTPGEPT